MKNACFTVIKDKEDVRPKMPADASYTMTRGEGYAEGTVRVTLFEGEYADDIVMYWANADGILADYTPLAKFKLINGKAKTVLPSSLVIPSGVSALYVYAATENGLLSETPFVIPLPEHAGYSGKGEPIIEFQVISDTHIVTDTTHKHDIRFVTMLSDVAAHSPRSQGIFIVGDMTDGGHKEEYETLMSLYRTVKSAPALYLTVGNHDLFNGSYADKKTLFLSYATLPDGSHPESMHYDFWLEGCHFVFLGNDQPIGNNTTLSKVTADWLDKTLADNHEVGNPIFLFLHQSLYDTVAGSLPGQGWNGVQNEAALRAVLAKHSDVMLFNGHSHWVLDSERTMLERSDSLPTIFNTSSCGYLWTSYDKTEGENCEGSEGYYLRVYPDRVEVLGRDFLNGKWVSSAQFVLL